MVSRSKIKLIFLLFITTVIVCLYLDLSYYNRAVETVVKFSKHGMKKFGWKGGGQKKSVICVLVLTCNRPSVKRTLDSIFKYRGLTPSVNFPVIVSQDCGSHQETTQVIKSYGQRVLHVHQPDLREIVPDENTKIGYYKQTRHHAWALNHAFGELKCHNVIVLEDDLEVAPDFFEYFAATLPIFLKDPSIYCVTASNINGKPGLINETAYDLLHRSDMLFGWGWMLTKKVFKSLGKWPAVYWDTWMGLPSVRQGRTCIRPEIPRTKNFGREGISGTEFFDTLVRDLIVNGKFVPFTTLDLSYLQKEKYNKDFAERIKNSFLIQDHIQLKKDIQKGRYSPNATFRIIYNDGEELLELANFFHLYAQTWNGMLHTIYNGVMTFMFHHRRIYLVPSSTWKGYNPLDDENVF